MRSVRVISIAGMVAVLMSISGCLGAPDIDRVRKDIQSQLPGVTFKKEIALSLGPAMLWLTRAFVSLAPYADEAAAYLEDIRDVTLAVYEVENLPRNLRVRLPEDLKRLLERGEWELTMKTCEDDESVWVLCKTVDDTINGIYVVVLDRENLVLVRAHGRIESLFKKAVREHAHIGDHA